MEEIKTDDGEVQRLADEVSALAKEIHTQEI
jgi:hypothetical protein